MNCYLERIPSNQTCSNRKRKNKNNSLDSLDKKCRLKQMYLDLGQKGFGKQMECVKCLMNYVKGDEEDENRHKIYCTSLVKPKYLPGTCRKNIDYMVISDQTEVSSSNFEIISIPSKTLQRDGIRNLIQKLLGEFNSSNEISLEGDLSCYFCINIKREILGCVLFEMIGYHQIIKLHQSQKVADILHEPHQAKKICDLENLSLRHKNSHSDDHNNYMNKSNLSFVGIRYLWTNESYRGLGIATKLIDTLCKFSTFGTVLGADKLAFSQPTDDGRCFAFSYTKSDEIWIYPGMF